MSSKLIRVAVLGAALAGCKEKAPDPPKKIEPVGQPSPDPAPAMREPAAAPAPMTGSGAEPAADTASSNPSRTGVQAERVRPSQGADRMPFPKDAAYEMLKKRREAAARAGSGSGSASADPKKP